MGRPNILFLLSDEHSFRFMGHVSEKDGGEPVETPTFDRLASQGTVFTDAYCQMPLCTPSRICMLTGMEVRRCGAWNNGSVLRPELPTIPGALAESGYETCLIGKMHLGGDQQFVGFRHRPYGDLTGNTGHQWEPLDQEGGLRGMRSRTAHVGVTEIPESLLQEQIVAQETLAFMREHAAHSPDQPLFLCASFSRPHFPLTAPRRHIDTYLKLGVTEPRVPASGDAYDHPMSTGMREGFQAADVDGNETKNARTAYFASVSYLDELIGDLLLRLDAAGLLENTIIVYTTDHGEMAGEHGVWWKNGWYEACTRVPFIISLPEQRAGGVPASTCRVPVSLADLFPTLCGLTGVPVPLGLDGIDLAAAVRAGATPPDRPVFCDALTPRWGAGTEFRSIRWRQFKYVCFRQAEPLFFDLADDPGEQRNLLGQAMTGERAEALGVLEAIARQSIDFEEAERERTERDRDLKKAYAQRPSTGTRNAYLMPSGKVVSADDPLYDPTVLASSPRELFGDMP